jgi:DNA (cytosine-5)-methyltransferase 1
MENVKGLLYLNGQADFHKMLNELKKLGYAISYAVLNATDFGVPQARERVYVIGHKNTRKNPFDFSMIVKTPKVNVLTPFLDKGRYAPYLLSKRFDMFDLNTVPPAPTRSGFIIKAEHGPYTEKKLFSSKGTIGTIMSSFSPFIYDERYKVVRNMSITEILRCQSFPVAFAFPPGISRSKALKYVGNAVCVNVVSALVHAMKLQGIIPY